MSSPIVTGLANTFRYLPQRTIEGIFGPNIGHRIEGWTGMSPVPDETGAQVVAMPDPNYHTQQLQQANESFRKAAEKPDLSTMRKPLPKGK